MFVFKAAVVGAGTMGGQIAQTIGQIDAKARMMVRKLGVKLIVLDYLQLVLPNRRAGRIRSCERAAA